MLLRALVIGLAACVVNGLGAASEASVITFTDRTAFQTAVGSPLSVETFDALAGTTVRTEAGLTIGGVNFVGIFPPDFFVAVVDDSTFPPLPAATSLSTVSHLRITFSAPVSAVGFDLYVTSSVLFGFDATLSATFSNGDVTGAALPPRETFLGFRTSTPFQVLDLTTVSSFLAIDNFYAPQASATVPEPTTTALVVGALAILGLRAGPRKCRHSPRRATATVGLMAHAVTPSPFLRQLAEPRRRGAVRRRHMP